jgi:RHS repeat-associated protein
VEEQTVAQASRYYVWGLDLSQSLQGAGGVGGLLAKVEGTTTHHFLHDGNGNVGQMINASGGAIDAHYEYDPYGNTIVATGSAAATNSYRFSTKYLDNESNLYYYGYRYYDPTTGRWLSRDPIEEEGGLNLYIFVLNNPINHWDYLGKSFDSQAVAALEWVLSKGCFWQCYLIGMTDNEIVALMQDIQNDLPSAARTIFAEWLTNQAQESPQRFLALLREIQKPIRILQGQGLEGSILGKMLGEKLYPALRTKIAQKSVRLVGKNGSKIFGRWGSKALPVIGKVLIAAEIVNICRCQAVCRDGNFTNDDTWGGIIGGAWAKLK